ncbi:MAG: hypothetical protein K6G47_05775 [Clostridia bacterium]|nr:hypothetical protein [Clostridia bacterium]
MKKSKIIAAGFALSMMLAVAACSSKEADETKAEATTTTTEETTTEETTEETTTEEETEATSEDTEATEETNEFGLPTVSADDYSCEAIKNLITENETSQQYMLMPMSYEDIDMEGYEEGLAAIDMASYDTILMLKFDSVDSAKTFITEFVEQTGVDVNYTEGADGALTFSAEVEGEMSTTVEGSIDAEGLITLTEKGPSVEESTEDVEAVAE